MEHYVCELNELVENKPICVRINDLEVGVILNRNEIYAFENHCAHFGGPVCLGDVFPAVKVELAADQSFVREYVSMDEPHLVCPWHGIEFDIQSGKSVGGLKYRLRKFKASTKDGQVFVSIA